MAPNNQYANMIGSKVEAFPVTVFKLEIGFNQL
jgi:hypothetical protein